MSLHAGVRRRSASGVRKRHSSSIVALHCTIILRCRYTSSIVVVSELPSCFGGMQNRRRFFFRFFFSREKHLDSSSSAPLELEPGRSRLVSAPVYTTNNDFSPKNENRGRHGGGRSRAKSSLSSFEPAQNLRSTPTDPLPFASSFCPLDRSAFGGDPAQEHLSSSSTSFSTSTTRSCSVKHKHLRETKEEEIEEEPEEEHEASKSSGRNDAFHPSSARAPPPSTPTSSTARISGQSSCASSFSSKKVMGPGKEEEEEDEKYIGHYEKLQEITLKRKSIIWLCRRRHIGLAAHPREVGHPAPSLFAGSSEGVAPASSGGQTVEEERGGKGEQQGMTRAAVCSYCSTHSGGVGSGSEGGGGG